MVKIRNLAPAWDSSDALTAPTMLNQMGKNTKRLEGGEQELHKWWLVLL